MPLWKRKIVWVPALCFSLVFGLIFWAYTQVPHWIVGYAKGKYPYLKFRGAVVLAYPNVEFHDVVIEKDWVFGELSKVTVDIDKNIRIQGGKLTILLDKRPKGTELPKSEGPKLQEVLLDVADVYYKDMWAASTNFSLQANAYCAEEVRVGVGGYLPSSLELKSPLYFEKACLQKDKTMASFKVMKANVIVPYDVPRMGNNLLLIVNDGEAYLKENKYLLAKSFGLVGIQEGAPKPGPYIQGKGIAVEYMKDFLPPTLRTHITETTVHHPWLAPEEETFRDTHALLSKEKSTVYLNGAGVNFDLSKHSIEGTQSCSEWSKALPQPMPPAVAAMIGNFTGDLHFEIQTKPVHVELTHTCQYECSKSPIKELSGKFTYEAYDKDGNIFTRETGPGSADWVSLARLPLDVPSPFIRLEDPSFATHKGILVPSLQLALQGNLKAEEFRLGGSTITQQLAKNIWLKRHKTFGRKVEEAFLTMALESCLPKNKILELYLNVVEYGPNLYGIGPAAKFYFEKEPEALTLDEAYYLALLLPNPRRAVSPAKGGLLRAQQYMAALANKGLISETLVPVREDALDLSGWKTVDDNP